MSAHYAIDTTCSVELSTGRNQYSSLSTLMVISDKANICTVCLKLLLPVKGVYLTALACPSLKSLLSTNPLTQTSAAKHNTQSE